MNQTPRTGERVSIQPVGDAIVIDPVTKEQLDGLREVVWSSFWYRRLWGGSIEIVQPDEEIDS